MDMQIKGEAVVRAKVASSYESHGAVNLYGLMSMQIPSVTFPSFPNSPEKKGPSGEEESERMCDLEPGPSDAHVSSV